MPGAQSGGHTLSVQATAKEKKPTARTSLIGAPSLVALLHPSVSQARMQPRILLWPYLMVRIHPQWLRRPISVSELVSPLSTTQVRATMVWPVSPENNQNKNVNWVQPQVKFAAICRWLVMSSPIHLSRFNQSHLLLAKL